MHAHLRPSNVVSNCRA